MKPYKITQVKFNFIMKEFRQRDLDLDNIHTRALFNEICEAAEILTKKQLAKLIEEHVELNWNLYY